VSRHGAFAFAGHLVLVVLAVTVVALTSAADVVRSLGRADVAGAAIVGALAAAIEASAQRRHDDVVTSTVGRALATATGALLFVVMVVAPALRVTANASPGAPSCIIGAVLALAGARLRGRSIRVLGADFVTEHRAPPSLVTHDVYAWVRHPSEIGLLALVLGVTTMAPTTMGIAAALVLGALVFVRVAREESRLAADLGGPYARYAAQVPAFVPRLFSR